MAIRETGGPAFPSYEACERLNKDTDRYETHMLPVGGMELRDYFAAKAMQVILHPANERVYDEVEIAGAAYGMADAMLKAREQ